MSESQPSLAATARDYWRAFAPAWVFPLVFLYGGLASERIGHASLFFWAIATPLFFWSFGRASAPWLRQEVSYWHGVFWSMVMPFLIWVLAVFSRLAVLGLLGNGNVG